MFQEFRGLDLRFTMSHRGEQMPPPATVDPGGTAKLLQGGKRLRCPDRPRWDHPAPPACRVPQARLDRLDLLAALEETAFQDQWELPALWDHPEHQLKPATESLSATAAL